MLLNFATGLFNQIISQLFIRLLATDLHNNKPKVSKHANGLCKRFTKCNISWLTSDWF